MRRNALAAMEDLDRARRNARPNLLTHQLVRHRVVVLVELDVVVEPDPALLPFGKDVGLGRQRLQRWAFELLEERSSARAEMARDPVIDLRTISAMAAFKLGEREELSVAQLGDDQPVATSTATSTLALSRGRYGRAGTTAVS